MRYKVGDKVRVKTPEQIEREFGDYTENNTVPFGYVSDMAVLCDKICEVKRVQSSTYAGVPAYFLKEDEWGYSFSEEVLIPYVKKNKHGCVIIGEPQDIADEPEGRAIEPTPNQVRRTLMPETVSTPELEED